MQFNNTNGTQKAKFYLGGAKSAFLEFLSNRFRFRNNADDAFLNVSVGNIPLTGSDNNDAVALMDLKGRVADISIAFNGGSPASVVNGSFAFCHTSGGSYTAGYIYYGKSSAWVQMPTNVCTTITTRTAISGTISLDANAIYAYEGSTWVKKGRGADFGWRCIAIPFTFSSSFPLTSTTLVPANSVVTRTIVNITTGFTLGSTLKVEVNSTSPITLMDSSAGDFDSDTANQYDSDGVVTPLTAGAVKVSKTGTMTDGEGVVYVLFGETES